MDEVLERLGAVRRTGFAHDRQEVLEGVECIAVPIDRNGVHYGMGVSVPAYRLDNEKESLIEQALTNAQRHIAQLLG